MKSPFPGMDPYLERFWPDVHASLIVYTRDQLEEQLPSNLIARVEERVVFEIEPEETRPAYPDVKITERPGKSSTAVALMSRTATAEPVIVEYEGPETETYINILEAGPGQRLVTVIEVLSLANKLAGDARRQYRQKQAELRRAGVSLVEIDLLRRGQWTLSVPRQLIPARARTPYQACVRRGWRPRRFEVYPVPLRKPLPAIGIPLRETDQDVTLDLQAIVETAYRKGRYHLTIDYNAPPDPPLRRPDVKWARSVIKRAGKK